MRAPGKALAGLAVAAVALAACEGGGRERGQATAAGDGLCKPFSGAAAAGLPGAGMGDGAALDDCLHRWGYTLAKAEDDADSVAVAVVAACSAPLARWNQQALSAAAVGAAPSEAPSLLTGETTNPIAQHSAFADGRALFYVVQARAGKCDPPRVGDRDREPARTAAAPAPNSPDP